MAEVYDIPGVVVCANCLQPVIMEEQEDGYATERWGGVREEEPYAKCPLCTATFPIRAIE